MLIRKRFFASFLAISIIPMLLVGLVNFYISREALKSASIAKLETIANLKAKTIEKFIEDLRQDITILRNSNNIKQDFPVIIEFARNRTSPEYLASKKMLDDQLAVWSKKKKEIIDFMLVGPDGKIVYVTNEEHQAQDIGNPLPDPKGRAFAEGKKGIYFTEIFRNKVHDGNLDILVAAPVQDFNGKFIGVIALEVNMDTMYELIQDTTGLGQTGETLLGKKIGNEALFLNPLRNDKNAALKRRVILGEKDAFPLQESVQGRNGSGISFDYRSVEIIAAWRYIPSMSWGLVAKMDTKEAFASIRNIKHVSIIFGIIVLFLIGMTAILMSFSITDPLRKLAKSAAQVGAGKLQAHVDIKSKDEIGDLSRAFNQMLEDLKRSTTSIDNLSKEITERKKAENELQKSKERHDLVVDATLDGIWDWDILTNKEYFSPHWCEILGYSYDDPELPHVHESWASRIHPDDEEHVIKAMKVHLEEGKPYNVDYRHRHKSGEYRWQNSRGKAIFNENGKPVRMVGCIRDITEHKKAEKEKQNLERQLLQSQKMESLGIMAGGVAHEFNNILTGIIGKAELSVDEIPKEGELYENIQQILKASWRGSKIVNQILAFSHKYQDEQKTISIEPIVKETIKLIKTASTANISIKCDIKKDLSCVLADPNNIHQVILNLCTNACHAMEDRGGLLELKLEEVSLDEKKLLDKLNLKPGNYIHLSVADSGYGIDKDIFDKIFDPFFTTKEVGKGTGLGLSTAYGIVEKCCGKIDVYTEKGKGSIFHVYLPTTSEDKKEESIDKKTYKGTGKILVVDDEKVVRDVAGRMLIKSGYEVHSVSSGLEAIKYYKENKDIDLVLIDIKMPGLDGRDTYNALKKIDSNIKALVITGYSSYDFEDILNIGVKGIIQKPFSKEALSKIVYETIEIKD